jgi:hypothetical protein
MTGEQLQADVFIGPTYYMRLKHMVKDKINYRALGPRTVLTRQTVQGRANDGGLRIGEMERDGILAHGASYFLNESFLKRGDEYFMAVCNKTGCIAIYNQPKNIFFSPFSDGPLQYHSNPDGSLNVQNISRFGRSFSLLRIPYALKLLIQELQVLNIQMRIITDENIDQLENMSFSNNIQKLLKTDNTNLEEVVNNYIQNINLKLGKPNKNIIIPEEKPELPEVEGQTITPVSSSSVPWATASPAYMPPSDELSLDTGSPGYRPSSSSSVPWATASPAYIPPSSDEFKVESLESQENPMKIVRLEETEKPKITILEVEEEKKEEMKEADEKTNINENTSSNEIRKIII